MTPPILVLADTREPALEAGDAPSALFHPSTLRRGLRVALPVERRHLETGDYSLPGLEHLLTIERKSLGDLINTIVGEGEDSNGNATKNLDRFRAECSRMKKMITAGGVAFILVEGSTRDVWNEARKPDRRFNPDAVLAALDSILCDFSVATVWTEGKADAELLAGFCLERWWSHHTGGRAWKKAEERGYAAELPWGPPEQLAKYRQGAE